MSRGTEHEEVAGLLGAYALDAVDPDEAAQIERHLEECTTCRGEADALREVAAALGTQAGLEGEDPPGEVWDRIATDVGARPKPVVLDHRRNARWVRARTWAAAAVASGAAAAIALLAVGLVNSQGRVHELQAALVARAPAAAVQAALAAPGHDVVRLRDTHGTAVAELVVEHDGAGYVVGSRMPPLPSGETYQLWASIDGKAISLGLLGSRPVRGGAFSLGSAANSARELMVTVEPAGGVVAPSAAPVATAPLSFD